MDLVIIGAGEVARMAFHYFDRFSPYTPRAFAVDPEYLTSPTLLGVPLLELDAARALYGPAQHQAFVALSTQENNHARARLYDQIKGWGYTCASFIHPTAQIGPGVVIGENVLIQELNNLQHGVHVGNDVILWAGNHVGHQTVIHDHVFLASHIVVSGYCEIGERSFIGVNVSVNDGVTIGPDCVVGNGTVVIKDLPGGGTYVGNPARLIQSKQEARES